MYTFKKYILNITILSIVFYLGACSAGPDDPGTEYAPNMYHAIPYEPLKQITDEDAGNWVSSIDEDHGEYYNSNPVNPYNMTMRIPPANSVRRNAKGYLPYRIHKDSLNYAARVLKNPLDSTEAVIVDGKILYAKFCTHCHGEKGQGDGLVGEVLLGVPQYNSPLLKNISSGILA